MKKFLALFLVILVLSAAAIASTKKSTSHDADTLKNCIRNDGLFTLWRDTLTGKVFLDIKKEQLGKEFIYFSFIADAPLSSYHYRGDYYDSKIIRFDKIYDHVEITQVNTGFYFDPNSPLSRSANANLNNPVLANEKIITDQKNTNSVLLDANNIFANEKLQFVIPQPVPGMPPPTLGTLNKDRSSIDRVRNYSKNTDFIVKLIYENPKPFSEISSLADGRNVTVYLQHTLVEVPQNDFKPRIFDPRIGYFTNHEDDQTTLDNIHWHDLIQRWNLVKKDPGQAISEPVQPIVYWIENTTPLEFRACIKQAVESWNGPFEKAGFKNAVVCKIQPDTASWDAGDINYNVLRWVSSPEAEIPFWAYGPSFTNPRTGQILGADVILEYDAIRTNNFNNTLFKTSAFHGNQVNGCSLQAGGGGHLQSGLAVMNALGMDDASKIEIVRQYIMYLVEHELGHTFGLTHNFHGSTLLSPEEMKNRSKVTEHGTISSVMDYVDWNINADHASPFLYYDTLPGIYDDWAIEFGYAEPLKDPAAEAVRLKHLLDKSSDPRLAYGNDEDIMRGAGNGIDPDVQQYDISNNSLAYAMDKCELYTRLFPKLKEKFIKKDHNYQELLNGYMAMMSQYSQELGIITKQIGAVHYNHCAPCENTSMPLTAVKENEQKLAMYALDKYAFSPDALLASNDLFNYLFSQRRGLDLYGTNDSVNQDPHLHELILGIQKKCLDNLLNAKVLLRIIDSHLYGNTYTIDKEFDALTNCIFNADAATTVSTIRQNLQSEYVTRLIAIMDKKSSYPEISKSMAMAELQHIDKMEMAAVKKDMLTNAHRAHISFMIKRSFEEK